MRRLFIISTAIFWLAVVGFWLTGQRQPAPPVAAIAPAVAPSLREYSLPEVAAHNRESNCWMAIEGQVYDVTGYLPKHPSPPQIVLPWCGKDATQAWRSKTIGRPHSSRAGHLLNQCLIGNLREKKQAAAN